MFNYPLYPKIIFLFVFVLASLTHLPNYVKIYGYSLTNWLIIGIVSMIIFSVQWQKIFISWPFILKQNGLLFMFLLFGISTTFFLNDDVKIKSFLQNTFIYFTFFTLLLYASIHNVEKKFKIFNLFFSFLLVTSVVIESYELWKFGLSWGDNLTPKNTILIDARSLSMIILLSMGWFIASWIILKQRFTFYIALISFTLLYLSLSRVALIIGFSMLVIAIVIRQPKNVFKEIFLISLLISVFIGGTFSFSSLQERYIGSTGIVPNKSHPISKFTDIGGIQIDTSGREQLWSDVWESFSESYYFGKGIGSAEMVKHTETFNEFIPLQPCNDHLRILHDFGILGYALFMTQILIWSFIIRKAYIYSIAKYDKIIFLNALLSIYSIVILGMTDNPIVYSYVMLPLAIIIGSALHQINKTLIK